MDVRQLTVEVRDKNLNRLGQIAPVDLDLLVEDQFSNVGSWTLNLRSDHPLAHAICTPGAGIIVSDTAGNTIMSGPVTETDDKATIQDPGGTITIDGLSDTLILADRLAYPDPDDGDATINANIYDVRTGPVEDLMHQYVSVNVGPGAPSVRRISSLQMGTNYSRGATVTGRARFDVLGNLLNTIAANSTIGFRILQVANHLEFRTFATNDHTADVRYDIYNNMLSGHSKQEAPAGVTRAIVAGDGTKLDRPFLEVTTADSLSAEALWNRRIEQFIDERSTTDATELAKAGEKALTDAGFAQVGIQVVPMEDIGVGDYGNKYTLGDWVTVVVKGVQYAVQVTGYVLKINATDGLKFGLVLGNPTATNQQAQVTAQVAKLEDRVSSLERNADGGTPVSAVSDLSDVTLSSPANGQVLEWNGTSGKWVNATLPTPTPAAVAILTDATVTSPVSGQVLQYNGTKWVNVKDALSNLSDVGITSPSTGQVLQYNGTRWVNGNNGVVSLATNSRLETDDLTLYPPGISLLPLGSGSGWSVLGGYGYVTTYYLSTSRTYQEFHSTNTNEVYTRTYYAVSSGGVGWGTWSKYITDAGGAIGGNFTVAGLFNTPSDVCGVVSITPSAVNTVTTSTVTYPTLPGTGTIYAFVSVNSGAPDKVAISSGGPSATSVTVNLYRTDGVYATNIYWNARRSA